LSEKPDSRPKPVDHRGRYATAGLFLVGLGVQPLLFNDLGSLRVFFAVSALLIGVVMFLRAVKPEWFLIASREESRFSEATRLFEATTIPAETRFGVWAIALGSCLVVSVTAALVHEHVFGGQKSQPVFSIPIAEIKQIVNEEFLAFWAKNKPTPAPSFTPPTQTTHAKDGTVRVDLMGGYLSFGAGSCSLFMNISGANKVTPLPVIAYLRMVNTLDNSVYIDSYTVQLSKTPRGPWIPTLSIPLGFGILYTIDNSLADRNVVAFRAALKAVTPGSRVVSQKDSVYRFGTSDAENCLKSVGLVDFSPGLSTALANGIPPHWTVEGWSAFNPSSSARDYVLDGVGPLYYRVILHSTSGTFETVGPFTSTPRGPEGRPNNTNVSIMKLGFNQDGAFAKNEIEYLGP
jgi:hypothetical protein